MITKTSKILIICSAILCGVGGIIFLFFGITYSHPFYEERLNPLFIVLGVFVILGAFAILKFPRRGSILCLALGLFGLFYAVVLYRSMYIFLCGIIFALLGAIVGFLGVMKE